MSRTARLATPVLVVLLLVGGCSRDGSGDNAPVTESGSGAAAADPLSRGLQAHVDGDLDGAVAAYEEVLADDPDNKLALYNLGLVQQSQGNNVGAENNYRRTLEVDPEYTPALFNLAILRTAAGDNEEAAELYERVVDLEDNAGAYLNLGFALRELGRGAQAQDAFDQAVELDPSLESRIED